MVRKNFIEMHSTHNEGVSKNAYIDKLDYIATEYSKIYHRTFKMKSIDVKEYTHFDYIKEVNDMNPKFKVGDHVRISKYKNIAKGYTPIWSEEVFVIKKSKAQFSRHMLLIPQW